MSDSLGTRKSARQRAPSRKIIEDGYTSLQNLLFSPDENATDTAGAAESPGLNSEEDLAQDAAASGGPSTDPEADAESHLSEESVMMTPDEDSDDEFKAKHSKKNSSLRVPTTGEKEGIGVVASTEGDRPRRTYDGYKFPSSSNGRIDSLAGPGRQEISHLTNVRDQYSVFLTVPKKRKFHDYIPLPTKEKRLEEATAGWDWYYDGGGRNFLGQRQELRDLKPEESTLFSPKPGDDLEFLLGPHYRQTLLQLPSLEMVKSRDADFEEPSAAGSNSQRQPPQQRGGIRPDWVFNPGGQVFSLDWIPNQRSEAQYLAVGTDETDESSPPLPSQGPPGCTPSPSSPSAIKIWKFPNHENTAGEQAPRSQEPQLACVYCTEWGVPRQLKWCPIPRKTRDEESRQIVASGLLAGIWGDGYARVLDLQLGKVETGTISYFKINHPAFAVRPANIICTCLCWLSPSDLAVGHSNGYLAVYNIYPDDLAQSSGASAERSRHPRPYLTIPPSHSGPLLTITSAYPSHPNLLATSYLSGYTRLLDLKHPTSDTIATSRVRAAPRNLAYSPHIFSMITTDEASQTIRAHSLRYWNTAVALAKTSVSADGAAGEFGGGIGVLGPGCIDAGKVHPCVVWGGPDGRVCVLNPVIKILRGKKLGTQKQVLVRHEWVQRRASLTAPTHGSGARNREYHDEYPPTALTDGDGKKRRVAGRRQGISRFTEGYKPEMVEFGSKGDKLHTTTLFEEETGVRAVCWNPNLDCGGWLAMAWRSGLVRVMDVAV